MSQIIVSSLTPSEGNSGEQVIITGSGFTGLMEVLFGNCVALSTFITDSQISAISPDGTGTLQVTVRTSHGNSNGLPFTYLELPLEMINISPSEGSVAGGDLVTILGSGFTQLTSVKFGNNPAVWTFLTDSQINAVSPPGTGTVDLTLTTETQTAFLEFTYLGSPVLNLLDPDSGPSSGGTLVSIFGQNLSDALSVTFGTQSPSFQNSTDLLIEAMSPPGLNSVPVTVTTPAGSSNTLLFTFILACLAYDTQILMADGRYKAIQEIVRGDVVAADLQLSKTYKVARVLKDQLSTHDPIDVVTMDSSSVGPNLPNQKLIITANHALIWKESRRPAKCFINYPNVKRETSVVSNILPIDEKSRYCVYDLQFETLGNFVANGIVVQSRSPRSNLTPLPQTLYFDQSLYRSETGIDDVEYEFPLDFEILADQ